MNKNAPCISVGWKNFPSGDGVPHWLVLVLLGAGPVLVYSVPMELHTSPR